MHTTPAWLADEALQTLFARTRAAGGEARAVGGAVRDFLMGGEGGDVDIASTLTPDETMALAAQAGWKAVPTGIAHGTVTLVLPTRVVEVTTLRRDVETDGRHATVAFTGRFEEDAARRDFTINALYMDAQGTIYDYFGGREDIHAKRVRFIGDAAVRIAEDALRMLRYFRFLATHGAPPADAQALAAIAAGREQLRSLSGERIAAEMKKLLGAAGPSYAAEQMVGANLPPLLTGGEWSVTGLRLLLNHERTYRIAADPWLRLMALVPPHTRATTAEYVAEHWKLSRAERATLQGLAKRPALIDAAWVKAQLRTHARALVVGQLLLAAIDSAQEMALPEWMALAQAWEVPEFPVRAADLMARGFTQGAALGQALATLERAWAESDYALSRETLLAKLG